MSALFGFGAVATLLVPGWLFARGAGRPWWTTLALAHLTGSAALAVGLALGMALTGRVHWGWGAAGLVALGLGGALRRSDGQEGFPTQAGPLTLWEWLLAGMVAAYDNPLPGDRSYVELIRRGDHELPSSYRWRNSAQMEFGHEATESLMQLARTWSVDQQSFNARAPRPTPELRISPRI